MIKEHYNADSTVTLEYCCDFCDYSTLDNRDSRGIRPIMECRACGRHVCSGHRRFYGETWLDSHRGMYCLGCWEIGKKYRDQMISAQHVAWEKENDLRLEWHSEGGEEKRRHQAERYRPKLGKILVSEGYIEQDQLEAALSEQMLTLGQVLVEAGRITFQELQEGLDYQKKVLKQLGEILKELGHSTPEDIDWALNRMKRKLGEILRDKQVLSDHDLHRALSEQQRRPSGS
jgi:hypothetical protein